MNSPNTYESLDDREAETEAITLATHTDDVSLLLRVMQQFLTGFRFMDGYVGNGSHDTAVLALCMRGFNSIRIAQLLLIKGYYSQAISMARSTEEDWAACSYIARNPKSAELWWKNRPPKPATIRKGIGFDKAHKAKLDESYQVLSQAAHPGRLAIETTLERSEGSIALHLGGGYNADFFRSALYMVLGSAIELLGVLVGYLHDEQAEWFKEAESLQDDVIKWIREVNDSLEPSKNQEKAASPDLKPLDGEP
jgi:hypothetical protein